MRYIQPRDRPRVGQEATAGRILGVDPALDRVPAWLAAALIAERLAGRDAQLLGHEVDAEHHLGHGMLDLQARVHLEEVEAIALDQELDRARPRRSRRPVRRPRAASRQTITNCLGQVGCGCFLDELLVAPLHRAIALPDGEAAAVLVAEDLDLDVPRPLEVLLHVDVVVAEAGSRLATGRLDRRADLLARADDAHAAAAAAGSRLDHDGIAVLVGERHHLVGRRDGIRRCPGRPRRRRGPRSRER